MCDCAEGAIDCMERPEVADLYCNAPVDCCTPTSLKLSDIDPGVFADPSTGTEAEQELIAKYEAAIEMAHHRLASWVCFARYVSGCILRAQICVEDTSCCEPNPCTTSCVLNGIPVDELSDYMHPDRIYSVYVGADEVAVNEEPATEGGWMLVTSGPMWMLYGPTIETGGTFTISITPKEPRLEWLEAVKSFACELVPGAHDDSCDRDAGGVPEFAPPIGWITNKIAVHLNRQCCAPAVQFGRPRSHIRFVKWTPIVEA